MNKLNLSSKELSTAVTFSKQQIVLVEKFIAERGTLSLESLDVVIVLAKQREKILLEKINARQIAEGIDIGVINECKRIAVDKKTTTQIELTNMDTEKRVTENMLIDQFLQEELEETRAQIGDWIQIRQIFIDIYPQAKTSPRTSRAELEASPTRFSLVKSRSTTSLGSPRFSSVQSSPRLLKKETN